MSMNPGMKMMVMQRSVERGKEKSEYGDNGRRMIGYDRDETESRRRRDRRGRFAEGGWESNANDYGNGYSNNYGNAYDAPRNAYNDGGYDRGGDYARMDGYGAESRRRRVGRGRFLMDDGEDEARGYNARMMGSYPQMHGGNAYGDIYAEGTIYAPGAMNKPKGMHGHHQPEEIFKPVDEQQARKWVKKMTYTEHDGGEEKHGEKFTTSITEQIRKMICPECKPWEFYVAMNAMYADYCKAAKSSGVDKPEFYGKLAEAFLCDEDAGEHKLQKYMEYIPE